MKFLKIIFTIVSAYTTFCQSTKSQTPTHFEADKMFKKIMLKEHIPGLAYAVIKDGRVLYMGTQGLESIPYKKSVTTNTAFQLASCSKIYTALLLGRLFDDKILNQDATISQYIDSIPLAWKNITILQLASHQSGIAIADYSKASNADQTLQIAKQQKLEYQPGQRSFYVSSDYWILQAIIEKVTGLSYFEALKKYVLKPLSLNHSFVNNVTNSDLISLDIIPDIAQEYHWHKEDSTLRISEMWFGKAGYTAGGIYASINDLAKIAIELDRSSFISKKTKQLISNPVLLNNGTPGEFGLGLVVNNNYQGHKIIEHSGGPALADFVRFDKEKYTFIVLTNNRGTYPYLAKALATLFIKKLSMPTLPPGYN